MNDTLIFVLSAVLVILIGAVVRGKSSAKTNATIMSRGKSSGIFLITAIAGLFGIGLFPEKLELSPALQTASSTADSALGIMSLLPKIRSGASSSSSMVPTASRQNAVAISISGPAQLHQSNESTGNEYHEGRWLKVSGTVQSIDQDMFNNIIVMLDSGDQFTSGHASLDSKYKNTLAGLRKGQRITLHCEGGAVIAGSLILRHCAPA